MARLEPSASVIINNMSGIANWLDHYLLLPHCHHGYAIVVPCKAVFKKEAKPKPGPRLPVIISAAISAW